MKTASPQRRLLFEPKESTPSPVKCSPTKAPAYQRYQSLAEKSQAPVLPLPYNYRFLGEVFRSIDTVWCKIKLKETRLKIYGTCMKLKKTSFKFYNNYSF